MPAIRRAYVVRIHLRNRHAQERPLPRRLPSQPLSQHHGFSVRVPVSTTEQPSPSWMAHASHFRRHVDGTASPWSLLGVAQGGVKHGLLLARTEAGASVCASCSVFSARLITGRSTMRPSRLKAWPSCIRAPSITRRAHSNLARRRREGSVHRPLLRRMDARLAAEAEGLRAPRVGQQPIRAASRGGDAIDRRRQLRTAHGARRRPMRSEPRPASSPPIQEQAAARRPIAAWVP